MTTEPLRRVLRALLRGAEPSPRVVVLHHLGLEDADVHDLPPVLSQVGRELGLTLQLDGHHGDVVVADHDFVARVSPQVLNAFLEDRMLITLKRSAEPATDTRQRAAAMHATLVQQLRNLAPRPGAAPHEADLRDGVTLPPSDFDSDFDSTHHAQQLAEAELDPDRAGLLNRLRRGLVDPLQPALVAGYGAQAVMRLDFAVGTVRVDELADQRLRLAGDVPYLMADATPGDGARTRDLDQVAWDIALSAGHFRLINSPVNWWHTPLIAQPELDVTVTRYTRLPRHLEMARVLARAPVSPEALRRQARVGVADLRKFIQAGLFLGLLHWLPARAEPSGR